MKAILDFKTVGPACTVAQAVHVTNLSALPRPSPAPPLQVELRDPILDMISATCAGGIRPSNLLVVLDGLVQSENVGSIIRSGSAFG